MRHGVRVALLATAFALGCFALGWWSAAAIGVMWGWVGRDRGRHPAVWAAVSAAIGWSLLLGWTVLAGEAGALLGTMATLFGIPGVLFPVATVIIGTALAVLGSWVGATLTPGRTGARSGSETSGADLASP